MQEPGLAAKIQAEVKALMASLLVGNSLVERGLVQMGYRREDSTQESFVE